MVALSFERSDQARTSERVDVIIMDCVKNGMDILGENGTATILYHIEARFALGELQIPHNPQGFVSALRYVFGMQAKVIAHAIMEQMRKNAKCDRGFLRFASILETSMTRDFSDEANYLATGNDLAVETSNQNADERSSRLFGGSDKVRMTDQGEGGSVA